MVLELMHWTSPVAACQRKNGPERAALSEALSSPNALSQQAPQARRVRLRAETAPARVFPQAGISFRAPSRPEWDVGRGRTRLMQLRQLTTGLALLLVGAGWAEAG